MTVRLMPSTVITRHVGITISGSVCEVEAEHLCQAGVVLIKGSNDGRPLARAAN